MNLYIFIVRMVNTAFLYCFTTFFGNMETEPAKFYGYSIIYPTIILLMMTFYSLVYYDNTNNENTQTR